LEQARSRTRAAAVILAAGSASRFGAVKVLAPLRGKPLLQHVLDAATDAGLAETVIVLGPTTDDVEAAVRPGSARIVVNAHPEEGLSGSVKVGLAALGKETDLAVILLGDQPRVGADVIRALLAASGTTKRPIVTPRYSGDGGPNPVVIKRAAWALADRLSGDRGLGPLIAGRPELVHVVPVEGENPDVDTPADLAALEDLP
jgi:molybdenum cofactor cytidylyltransferase